MTAALETSQDVRAALENLQKALEQLRGEYVHGINTEADYARATVLLDELTDGHELNKYEEQMLIELEDAILAYERDSSQFKDFNASFKASTSPVQLIKHLMEALELTGSDLPEIGDKTVVSKVLSGDRPISHKMAYALAQRFHMDSRSFLSEDIKPSPKPALSVLASRTRNGRVITRKLRPNQITEFIADETGLFIQKPAPKTNSDQQLAASSRPRKPDSRPSVKR